jgi:hypothetical protein
MFLLFPPTLLFPSQKVRVLRNGFHRWQRPDTATLELCLGACAVALGMVLAGRGSLVALRLLREIRSKTSKAVTYVCVGAFAFAFVFALVLVLALSLSLSLSLSSYLMPLSPRSLSLLHPPPSV